MNSFGNEPIINCTFSYPLPAFNIRFDTILTIATATK